MRNVRTAGGQSCPTKRAGRAARRKRCGGCWCGPSGEAPVSASPGKPAQRQWGLGRQDTHCVAAKPHPARLRRPTAPEKPQEGRGPSGSIVAKERDRFTQACTLPYRSSCRTCRNRPIPPRCLPFTWSRSSRRRQIWASVFGRRAGQAEKWPFPDSEAEAAETIEARDVRLCLASLGRRVAYSRAVESGQTVQEVEPKGRRGPGWPGAMPLDRLRPHADAAEPRRPPRAENCQPVQKRPESRFPGFPGT